jgi:hypothetical protein
VALPTFTPTAPRPSTRQNQWTAKCIKPNGIALLKDGAFLLAHLGVERGGIFKLERDGRTTPWLTRVDGVDLPPANFVVEDNAAVSGSPSAPASLRGRWATGRAATTALW